MESWFSHYLADAKADIYETYQSLRPDYRKAMSVLRTRAKKILRDKSDDLSVLDVACGDGIATRQVFGNSNLMSKHRIRFVGLDHDANLLAEAHRRWPSMITYHADMVRAKIQERFDLILCSFAYHHVADSEKSELCKCLLKWCKPEGHLLVLDICLSQAQVTEYYNKLKTTLKSSPHRPGCSKFLDWTKSADCLRNGEWKVPLSRLQKDFKDAGWVLHDRSAVWTSPSLPPATGCFFFHFQPNH